MLCGERRPTSLEYAFVPAAFIFGEVFLKLVARHTAGQLALAFYAEVTGSFACKDRLHDMRCFNLAACEFILACVFAFTLHFNS